MAIFTKILINRNCIKIIKCLYIFEFLERISKLKECPESSISEEFPVINHSSNAELLQENILF